MIIKDLELTHFGKFHNKTVALKPGVNIIYGRNEAGKSTVHSFIRGMLFGIEKQRGKASHNDRYSRYEPWEDGAAYGGKMRIETGGHVYRLERSFLKTNKYFRLIDETEGKELVPAQEQLTQLLGGLTETNFINTISVEQLKSATDSALMNELQRFITNMGSTKSAEIDLADAKGKLLEQKKRMEKRLTPEAKEEYGHLAGQMVNLDRELREFRQEEKATEKQCESIEEKLKKLNAENLRHMQGALEERETLKKQAIEAKRMLEESQKEEEELSRKKRWGIVWLLISAVFAMAGIYVCIQQPTVDMLLFKVGIIYGFCFVIFLLLGIGQTMVEGRRKKKLLEVSRKNEEIKKQAADAAGRYLAICRNVDSGKERENYIKQEQEQLVLQQKTLTRIQVEIERREEMRQEVIRQGELLKKTLKENQKIQEEIRAIVLALDTMDALTEKLHDSFGGQLNDVASAYLKEITDGRYQKLVVREDMRIFVNTPKRLIPLASLSRGTIEQIYLCIRLAAARLLWRNEKMPLIFDDIFAFYDDERLRKTIALLESLDQQVIIFSCHTRENRFITSHS